MAFWKRPEPPISEHERWHNLVMPAYRARGAHMKFHAGAVQAAVAAAIAARGIPGAQVDAAAKVLDRYKIQPGDMVAPERGLENDR